MTPISGMLALLVPMLMLSTSANAQPAPAGSTPPTPTPAPPTLTETFWGGLRQINMLFNRAGSLAGGATKGTIWRLDLATGAARPIAPDDDLSWPIAATADGPVFALRGRQLIRLDSGRETPIGAEAPWRKLLGVLPDGGILGFAVATPRGRPAILPPGGPIRILDSGATEDEQRREGTALQEDRDYADGTRLQVQRSARGGQGFDIVLLKNGTARNLTDCGADRCGQPSITGDGRAVLYIRQAP